MPATRAELVDHLVQRGALESDRIRDAFRTVSRDAFVPDEHHDAAYSDTPLPIGADQTISAPHMVAHMTELLTPQPDDRVLEIGAGSGYQAAILAELADTVITIEIVEELAVQARKRLEDYRNVTVVNGDGSTGYEPEAPYDRILYTAAAPAIPDQVFDQLAEGGTLVAPVGGTHQNLHVYTRDGNDISQETYYGVRFVPLTGEEGKP
jgi:protein-L-isoaspartate(D-aspartate) O-methyltransferase